MVRINVYKDEMYPVYYQCDPGDVWTNPPLSANVDEEELKQFEQACHDFHKWQNWLKDKCNGGKS